jgi:hypothetical protein
LGEIPLLREKTTVYLTISWTLKGFTQKQKKITCFATLSNPARFNANTNSLYELHFETHQIEVHFFLT